MNVASLSIEITSSCNLRCSYCYNDSGKKEVFINFEKLCEVIDSCKKLGINTLVISGGEPFLYKEIVQVILFAKKKEIEHIVLATNGISDFLITNREIIEKLDFLQISLDSDCERINDIYRGKDSCILVKNNIELLCELGFNKKIVINCVLHKNNIESIEKILHYGLKNRIKAVNFDFILKQGRSTNEMIINDPALLHKVRGQIELFKKKLVNNIEVGVPIVRGKCPFLFGIHNRIFPKIDYDGNVYICNSLVDKRFIIGNIYDDKFEHIIQLNRIQSLEPIFNQFKEKCDKCKNSMKCSGDCITYYSCDSSNTSITCRYKNFSSPSKIFLQKIEIED